MMNPPEEMSLSDRMTALELEVSALQSSQTSQVFIETAFNAVLEDGILDAEDVAKKTCDLVEALINECQKRGLK